MGECTHTLNVELVQSKNTILMSFTMSFIKTKN
jgi:hypothetical protein